MRLSPPTVTLGVGYQASVNGNTFKGGCAGRFVHRSDYADCDHFALPCMAFPPREHHSIAGADLIFRSFGKLHRLFRFNAALGRIVWGDSEVSFRCAMAHDNVSNYALISGLHRLRFRQVLRYLSSSFTIRSVLLIESAMSSSSAFSSALCHLI